MRPQLRQTLQSYGQSLTIPRQAVFDYLIGRGPVSTKEIIAACLSRADRASIYRTLELFARIGITQELVLRGRKVIELSQDFASHHHHLVCTACGKSIDIADKVIERRLDNITEQYGFLSTSHAVEVAGMCPNCR